MNTTTTDLSPPHFAAQARARELEGAPPIEIVRWAHDYFGGSLVVTTSFDDAVLVHVAATAVAGIEIVLIDTEYLFAETLWYAETLRRTLELNLTIVRPATTATDQDRWQHDPDGCCGVRKVEPLKRALQGRRGWVTGLRRADGPTRVNTRVVSFDVGRQVAKINPLAAMTDDEVDEYHLTHGLPRNPLTDRGYPSIGCWPCTRPVQPGEDRRAGRWSDSDKSECGLHL